MRTVRLPFLILSLIALGSVSLPAQVETARPDSLFQRLASSQRAKVTRAELERSLSDIEAILASSAYGKDLKAQKEQEAAVIRRRLVEGDIRPGDIIMLAVQNMSSLSQAYPVTADNSIILPTIGEVKLPALLRSEIEDYLRDVIARHYVDPVVRADAQIRLGIFGCVGRQAYFVTPASAVLPDVIMQNGGGPGGTYKPERSKITRNDQVIVDGETFLAAVREGRSLDELGLQSGDEIHVGKKRGSPLAVLGVVSSVASMTWLLMRIF
mgnify:CR=1 FL=1